MLIAFIVFIGLLLVWCLLFARLEAEIEGPNGWAKILPTPRYHYEDGILSYRAFDSSEWVVISPGTFKAKFYTKYIGILGGKDFTTYHRVVDLIQLFVAHLLVYLCFQDLNPWWLLEIRAIATVMLIWSLEDTLWFYVNPSAGQSGHHKDWIMIGSKRLMEKGMFGNFVGGVIILFATFLSSIWGLLS